MACWTVWEMMLHGICYLAVLRSSLMNYTQLDAQCWPGPTTPPAEQYDFVNKKCCAATERE